MIPQQLCNPDFRFILLLNRDKIPLEKDWQKTKNYSHDNYRLQDHIISGGNYGCATGYGNVIVIDFDDKNIEQKIAPLLPPTFTTKSGKGGLHKWFIADKPESFKVLDKDKNTLADIQGIGKQIVCPGSTHPNGNKYGVVDETPIAKITIAEVKALFSEYLPITADNNQKVGLRGSNEEISAIKQRVRVPDLLRQYGINTTKNPTECPFHSSKGGKCLSYKDDLFHCFHCDKGGDIFTLLMEHDNCSFVEAKNNLAKQAGITITNKKMLPRLNLTNYQENAETFYESNPYFYDVNELFWLWDTEQSKYAIKDEVDIMRLFDEVLGFEGQTISSGVKNNHLEAFKRAGRKHHPKESPLKWIQFKNKAFSISSGKIYEVTPNYFFTNPIPWELGETSETPVMDKLFTEWVGSTNVKTLYELIAYCCYRAYPIQILFCLYGGGRNGKTSFTKILNKFFGIDNITSTNLDLLVGRNRNRFESFKLYKKLLCSIGETNFGILDNSSILKMLVGGDMLCFEMKNKNPFSEYNYAKLLIASNSLPSSTDESEGFYRRWLIIDFPNQFPEGKDIVLSIPDQEFKNLAKKTTEILPILLEKGEFTNQGSIAERRERYIAASNPLSIFLERYCERDMEYYVGYNELFNAYTQYLIKNKRRRVKLTEFKLALQDEGLYPDKTSKKVNDVFVCSYWIDGIKLKPYQRGLCDNYDNYDNICNSPPRTSCEVQTWSQMSQLSQTSIKPLFESSTGNEGDISEKKSSIKSSIGNEGGSFNNDKTNQKSSIGNEGDQKSSIGNEGGSFNNDSSNQNIDSSNQIINFIKNLDEGNGVTFEMIFSLLSVNENVLQSIINHCIKVGTIFEVTPGRYKVL